ncbi:KTSC domain-containing protein [Mucilaginibacter rivuli]|uniref:KTSC domain-containing protein n=1 Tax=Mucilaginibacter rivuli TaxID=2857527 RepID=UPI0034E2C10B
MLELQFRDNGAVWQYANIPADIYSRFISAESKGNFFVTHIKGHYPEQRIS